MENFFDGLKDFDNKGIPERVAFILNMTITLKAVIGCAAVTSREALENLTSAFDKKDAIKKVDDVTNTLEMLNEYAEQMYWFLCDGIELQMEMPEEQEHE